MKWRAVSLAVGVVATAGAAVLVGCGGGGGGGSSLTSSGGATGGDTGGGSGLKATPMTARIVFPEGAKAQGMTALRVWTSAAQTSPEASGEVRVTVYNEGPQYTEALDSQGRMVAAGFLGKDRNRLGADSTAELMAYFAVGGPLQRGEGNSLKVLEAVKTMPGYDRVLAEVTDAMKADGYVSAEDPELKAALDTMRKSLLTARSGRGPSISPSKSASGLELDDAVDEQVTVTNTFYRRVYAWLVRTGYKDASGNTTSLNVPISDGWIAMPSRYGGQVDSATGLIQGQYEWTAVPTSPHKTLADIPEASGEVESYYKLVTVGPGKGAGDFNKLTTAQSIKWEETVYWTAYLDFYVPIFANMALPLTGTNLDRLTDHLLKSGQAQAFVSEARGLMPTVASNAAQGRFSDAVRDFVSSSHTATKTLPLTRDLMLEWGRGQGAQLFTDGQDLINRVGQAEKRIAMFDLVDATDELAPLMDIAQANLTDIFEITNKQSEISLRPELTSIGVTDTTDIQATIKGKAEGGQYRYEWTVGGDYFLMDGGGNSTDKSPGGVLRSSYDKVFIGSLTNNPGTATIQCKGVRTDGGERSVGSAQTRVQFKTGISVYRGTLAYASLAHPPKPGQLGGYEAHLLAVAAHKKNAVSYSVRVIDDKGNTFNTASWTAERPYHFAAPELRAQEPANADIYPVYSVNAAYVSGNVDEKLAELLAKWPAAFRDYKVVVTATLK
ncbi:hypothetical protein EON79_00700 [bacterium]|nr:MAG: hypothetical protein EON79_00700 [bacterium]